MATILRDPRSLARTLGDNRQTMRRAVTFRARLRDRSASRFEIKLIDLSPTGFRAETAYRLSPGATVWINLPGLASIESVIAWQNGEQIGAAFRVPLHPAVFEHIVELGGR